MYRVAVEFQLLAASIVAGRRLGALRDQLDRASVSIVLNVAEGSGRFAPADKAHFYLIARGSAMECLAALSLLYARSLVSPRGPSPCPRAPDAHRGDAHPPVGGDAGRSLAERQVNDAGPVEH